MNKELIKKHLERWEGLQVASIQNYAETGKISGFLYLAIEKMLDEHAKEAYNQAIRDADEHIISRLKPIINAQFIYDSIKITKLLK